MTMTEYNLNRDFIDYWDRVVSNWFCGRIDKKQRLFLDRDELKLNILHMPEPYWGDPENCSIVIANYNPGGGADRNRHTYHNCANCPDSFINQVRNHGYSYVVKPFPIIDKPTETFDKAHPCWWKEYGGRKWWLNKKKWIDTFLNGIWDEQEKSAKKPFAIEFCGWHSVNWPSYACSKLYKTEKATDYILQYFIQPLTEAIKASDAKLGLCIGSQFYHLFETIEKANETKKTMLQISHLNDKYIHIPSCELHIFKINDALVFVIWGKGRSRYPSIETNDFSSIKDIILNYKNSN